MQSAGATLSSRLAAPLQAAMPTVSMLSFTSSGTQNKLGRLPLLLSTCSSEALS